MDNYAAIRKLSFPALAGALGIDLERFKHRQNEWHGYCPVHESRANNNCFHYQDGSGKWHCFSCGAKGSGAIDLAKAVKSINFTAAVELLRSITPPAETPRINDSGVSESHRSVDLSKYKKFAKPCEWLEKRIPDQAVRERYGVFFYQNDSRKSAFNRRVMIPVKDVAGNLCGYLGRHILDTCNHGPDGENRPDVPKYIFPRGLEKSKFLFGAHELWEGCPHRIVYLVESPFCVMKFASLGFPAVAAYGWSISEEQVELLATLAKGCIYLPDRNKHLEASTCIPAIGSKLWVRFPPLPEGIDDPEKMSFEQILAL